MSDPALDWDDLRLVLDLADCGTLSAAARRRGVDQTTASRRLARLEKRLGLGLFDRIDRRFVALPAVTEVVGELRAMAETARRVETRLAGERLRLDGHVSVSTLELLATRIIAPALADFRRAHPGVRLSLDLTDANVSIAARQADIAVRLARPAEDDALARRIGRLAFGLYGPAEADAPERLPLAAYGEKLAHVPESRWLAEHMGDVVPSFRADTAAALLEAAVAGHRAVLPRFLAETDRRLAPIATPAALPTREIWLLVHPERRRDPSVAATVDWLAATFAARADMGVDARADGGVVS